MKWKKLNKKEDKMDIVWSLPPLFKGRQVNFVITFRNYFTISKMCSAFEEKLFLSATIIL